MNKNVWLFVAIALIADKWGLWPALGACAIEVLGHAAARIWRDRRTAAAEPIDPRLRADGDSTLGTE